MGAASGRDVDHLTQRPVTKILPSPDSAGEGTFDDPLDGGIQGVRRYGQLDAQVAYKRDHVRHATIAIGLAGLGIVAMDFGDDEIGQSELQ